LPAVAAGTLQERPGEITRKVWGDLCVESDGANTGRTGELDQAAPDGVLNRILAFGLELVALSRRMMNQAETEGACEPPGIAEYPQTDPSLIRSLIQLRLETFGSHHTGQAAEVTDPLEPQRTPAHRLGKRVEGNPSRVESCILRPM
jgi:hypothetical protein